MPKWARTRVDNAAGDDAAAGVQLGEEIGGKGKGLPFLQQTFPVQPCRDPGNPVLLGRVRRRQDLADGLSHTGMLV